MLGVPNGFVALCFTGCVTAFQTVSVPPCLPRHHHGRRRPFATLDLSATMLNIDQGVPRDIGTMDEWATYYGVQKADGFELVSTSQEGGAVDDDDVSIMTTLDLPADNPVLFVPSNLILSSTLARQELYNDSVQQAEELLGRYRMDQYLPEFALYLKIITELEQGDESPWFPWFNSLPRTYYNGASMTGVYCLVIERRLTHPLTHPLYGCLPSDLCYECLPPLVSSLAREERSKNTYFRTALNRVDFVSDETKNNDKLTTWAFQAVCTRSFVADNDGDLKIAPIADMVRCVWNIKRKSMGGVCAW